MKLNVLNMNDDGSATCEVDISDEEVIFFVKIGIIKALEDAVQKKRDEDEAVHWEVS